MSIRPEFRWWILTAAVVAVLLGISALALDRPDVVWTGGRPSCPHCRTDVPMNAVRCPTCREQFEWAAPVDEDSPISPWSLSALEDRRLRDLVAALGPEASLERVGAATGLSAEGARAWLEEVGWGACGWCGGTGQDLARPSEPREPCPACAGRGRSVACDGDRRIRIGDGAAERASARYQAAVLDVSARLPIEMQRQEVRRLTEEFLGRWHGTIQATRAWFWPEYVGHAPEESPRAVARARQRLDEVLVALAAGR